MPRRLPEELVGKELLPLCVAANLYDAKRIEATLDRAGIDYTFEITSITGKSILGILFGSAKDGVMNARARMTRWCRQREAASRTLQKAAWSQALQRRAS